MDEIPFGACPECRGTREINETVNRENEHMRKRFAALKKKCIVSNKLFEEIRERDEKIHAVVQDNKKLIIDAASARDRLLQKLHEIGPLETENKEVKEKLIKTTEQLKSTLDHKAASEQHNRQLSLLIADRDKEIKKLKANLEELKGTINLLKKDLSTGSVEKSNLTKKNLKLIQHAIKLCEVLKNSNLLPAYYKVRLLKQWKKEVASKCVPSDDGELLERRLMSPDGVNSLCSQDTGFDSVLSDEEDDFCFDSIKELTESIPTDSGLQPIESLVDNLSSDISRRVLSNDNINTETEVHTGKPNENSCGENQGKICEQTEVVEYTECIVIYDAEVEVTDTLKPELCSSRNEDNITIIEPIVPSATEKPSLNPLKTDLFLPSLNSSFVPISKLSISDAIDVPVVEPAVHLSENLEPEFSAEQIKSKPSTVKVTDASKELVEQINSKAAAKLKITSLFDSDLECVSESEDLEHILSSMRIPEVITALSESPLPLHRDTNFGRELIMTDASTWTAVETNSVAIGIDTVKPTSSIETQTDTLEFLGNASSSDTAITANLQTPCINALYTVPSLTEMESGITFGSTTCSVGVQTDDTIYTSHTNLRQSHSFENPCSVSKYLNQSNNTVTSMPPRKVQVRKNPFEMVRFDYMPEKRRNIAESSSQFTCDYQQEESDIESQCSDQYSHESSHIDDDFNKCKMLRLSEPYETTHMSNVANGINHRLKEQNSRIHKSSVPRRVTPNLRYYPTTSISGTKDIRYLASDIPVKKHNERVELLNTSDSSSDMVVMSDLNTVVTNNTINKLSKWTVPLSEMLDHTNVATPSKIVVSSKPNKWERPVSLSETMAILRINNSVASGKAEYNTTRNTISFNKWKHAIPLSETLKESGIDTDFVSKGTHRFNKWKHSMSSETLAALNSCVLSRRVKDNFCVTQNMQKNKKWKYKASLAQSLPVMQSYSSASVKRVLHNSNGDLSQRSSRYKKWKHPVLLADILSYSRSDSKSPNRGKHKAWKKSTEPSKVSAEESPLETVNRYKLFQCLAHKNNEEETTASNRLKHAAWSDVPGYSKQAMESASSEYSDDNISKYLSNNKKAHSKCYEATVGDKCVLFDTPMEGGIDICPSTSLLNQHEIQSSDASLDVDNDSQTKSLGCVAIHDNKELIDSTERTNESFSVNDNYRQNSYPEVEMDRYQNYNLNNGEKSPKDIHTNETEYGLKSQSSLLTNKRLKYSTGNNRLKFRKHVQGKRKQLCARRRARSLRGITILRKKMVDRFHKTRTISRSEEPDENKNKNSKCVQTENKCVDDIHIDKVAINTTRNNVSKSNNTNNSVNEILIHNIVNNSSSKSVEVSAINVENRPSLVDKCTSYNVIHEPLSSSQNKLHSLSSSDSSSSEDINTSIEKSKEPLDKYCKDNLGLCEQGTNESTKFCDMAQTPAKDMNIADDSIQGYCESNQVCIQNNTPVTLSLCSNTSALSPENIMETADILNEFTLATKISYQQPAEGISPSPTLNLRNKDVEIESTCGENDFVSQGVTDLAPVSSNEMNVENKSFVNPGSCNNLNTDLTNICNIQKTGIIELENLKNAVNNSIISNDVFDLDLNVSSSEKNSCKIGGEGMDSETIVSTTEPGDISLELGNTAKTANVINASDLSIDLVECKNSIETDDNFLEANTLKQKCKLNTYTLNQEGKVSKPVNDITQNLGRSRRCPISEICSEQHSGNSETDLQKSAEHIETCISPHNDKTIEVENMKCSNRTSSVESTEYFSAPTVIEKSETTNGFQMDLFGSGLDSLSGSDSCSEDVHIRENCNSVLKEGNTERTQDDLTDVSISIDPCLKSSQEKDLKSAGTSVIKQDLGASSGSDLKQPQDVVSCKQKRALSDSDSDDGSSLFPKNRFVKCYSRKRFKTQENNENGATVVPEKPETEASQFVRSGMQGRKKYVKHMEDVERDGNQSIQTRCILDKNETQNPTFRRIAHQPKNLSQNKFSKQIAAKKEVLLNKVVVTSKKCVKSENLEVCDVNKPDLVQELNIPQLNNPLPLKKRKIRPLKNSSSLKSTAGPVRNSIKNVKSHYNMSKVQAQAKQMAKCFKLSKSCAFSKIVLQQGENVKEDKHLVTSIGVEDCKETKHAFISDEAINILKVELIKEEKPTVQSVNNVDTTDIESPKRGILKVPGLLKDAVVCKRTGQECNKEKFSGCEVEANIKENSHRTVQLLGHIPNLGKVRNSLRRVSSLSAIKPIEDENQVSKKRKCDTGRVGRDLASKGNRRKTHAQSKSLTRISNSTSQVQPVCLKSISIRKDPSISREQIPIIEHAKMMVKSSTIIQDSPASPAQPTISSSHPVKLSEIPDSPASPENICKSTIDSPCSPPPEKLHEVHDSPASPENIYKSTIDSPCSPPPEKLSEIPDSPASPANIYKSTIDSPCSPPPEKLHEVHDSPASPENIYKPTIDSPCSPPPEKLSEIPDSPASPANICRSTIDSPCSPPPEKLHEVHDSPASPENICKSTIDSPCSPPPEKLSEIPDSPASPENIYKSTIDSSCSPPPEKLLEVHDSPVSLKKFCPSTKDSPRSPSPEKLSEISDIPPVNSFHSPSSPLSEMNALLQLNGKERKDSTNKILDTSSSPKTYFQPSRSSISPPLNKTSPLKSRIIPSSRVRDNETPVAYHTRSQKHIWVAGTSQCLPSLHSSSPPMPKSQIPIENSFIASMMTSKVHQIQTSEASTSGMNSSEAPNISGTAVTVPHQKSTPSPKVQYGRQQLFQLSLALYEKEKRVTSSKIAPGQKSSKVKEKNIVKSTLEQYKSGAFDTAALNTALKKLDEVKDTKMIAKYIVKYLSHDNAGSLDQMHTPPAPPLTNLQQRLITLVMRLQVTILHHEMVTEYILSGIEYKISRLGHPPNFEITIALTRFYTALCKILPDKFRVQSFCLMALYCLKFKAHAVIYTILTVYPEVLPMSSCGTGLPLVDSIIRAIMAQSPNCAAFFKVAGLKELLNKVYGYNRTEVKAEDLLNELMEKLRGGCVEQIEPSIIILSKRQDWSWAVKYIVLPHLQPIINDWKGGKVSEQVVKEAIRLLGYVLRCFPKEQKMYIQHALNNLEDLLIQSDSDSHGFKETISSGLICLSKYDCRRVITALSKWQPKQPISMNLRTHMQVIMRQRNKKWWRKYIRTLL